MCYTVITFNILYHVYHMITVHSSISITLITAVAVPLSPSQSQSSH